MEGVPGAEEDVLVVNKRGGALDLRQAIAVECGGEYLENGRSRAAPVSPPVAVLAAGALQQQVGGRKLADHDVEVQIEALLDHLRGNQDGAARSACRRSVRPAWLAKALQAAVFSLLAVFEQEPGMEEIDVRQLRIGKRCERVPQQCVDFLGAVHRVADDGSATAVAQLAQEVRRQSFHAEVEPLNAQLSPGLR